MAAALKWWVLALGLLCTGYGGNAKTCKYTDTPIQANFDIDKITGKWYQYLWLPAPYQVNRTVWDDLSITLTKAGDGHLERSSRARKTDGATCCDEWDSKLLPQMNAPGKFDYERNWNDTNLFKTDWLVTSTDYDNYIVFYGCRETASGGTCPRENMDSYVFTRATTVSSATNSTIAQELDNLCLDFSLFKIGMQLKDCKIAGEIDCTSGGSGLVAGTICIMLLWLFTSLLA